LRDSYIVGTGQSHPHFVALLHNLLTLLLAHLEKTGLEQDAIIKRKTKLLDKTPEASRGPTHEMIRPAFPLSCQFVRATRNMLRFNHP
jgi:hypothetical protein